MMNTSEILPSKQDQEYLHRCPSPEVTYPYPLYKDPAMEKLRLAHMKQNQVRSYHHYLCYLSYGTVLYKDIDI